jgi:hypothetical protein
MTGLLTPGVYRQPLEPVRSAGRLARGDIPALLGYATRGPVGLPIRVYSVRQYEEVFGPTRTTGFLWHAVKGFFETGGRTAYVLRVATASARAASVDLTDGLTAGAVTWRAEASFPWPMIDPRRLSGTELAEAQGWVQVFERQLLDRGRRSPDPGSWGNGLSVSVVRASRVRTQTVPEVVGDGTAVRLVSLAGLEEASVLELTQEVRGVTRRATLVPGTVDRDRQLVRWRVAEAPTVFELDRPIRVASVEFDITVHLDGRPEQSFSALAPHPGHSFSIVEAMANDCRSLLLRPVIRRQVGDTWVDEDPERLGAVDCWSDSRSWPQEGTYLLGGGTDGLEDMSARTWLQALPGVGVLDDAAMIAAPDLVLPHVAAPPVPAAPPPPVDCSDLTPTPLGHLSGVVTTVGANGEDVPLPGVQVDVAGPGGFAVTGKEGGFVLSGIEEGLLTLRLRKPGYEPLELLTQSSPFASAAPIRLAMARIVTPRSLHPDEVLTVQQAMTDPSRVGPYKIAFLDPPTALSRLDQIATWRSRLGDNARMGFFAPWLTLPVQDTTGGRLVCPPSGHVCGAFAAAELAVGIHRTGANLPLRYVDGTTLAIGDEGQAGLNPVAINAIRAFSGRGIRVFGSRTLASDPAWRFLTARRVVDAIEKTLERALQWMVFEPNNLITRQSVAATASTLLGMLHRDGVLAGTAPEEAYAVRCDEENNPEESRDTGRLVVDIAVAPTNPYEFVLFRLGRTYDALDVTEHPS